MIKRESIQVGQCYLTRSGQVRQVRSITEGRVLFDSRKRPPKGAGLDLAPRHPRPEHLRGHDRAARAL